MTYDFRIEAADAGTMYRDLASALEGLISGEPDAVANMANAMSQTCKNEKLAMTLQYVAIGSMVVMGLAAATHMLKDMFGHRQHGR